MRKPRQKAHLPSSTGEKYISVYKNGYRLQISWMIDGKPKTVISKKFRSLCEAVKAREVFLRDWKHPSDCP